MRSCTSPGPKAAIQRVKFRPRSSTLVHAFRIDSSMGGPMSNNGRYRDPLDDAFGDEPEEAATPAIPREPPYLSGLNPEQREAVLTVDGPVLVLAGAGTGKTRVLTSRLAHILASRRAFPGELLAVTFTNKAAREMRERLEAMIGRAADGLWLGTFHAIAARILRRHAEAVGLKSSFTILDTDDQIRLLKQILQAENIDERRWPARLLLAQIQRWKDRGLGPEKVPANDA